MLPTKMIIKMIFIVSLITVLTRAQSDEDLIDIANITVFPQDYSHKIYAGYLNITPYEQAFYYIYTLRYIPTNLAKTILKTILSSSGSTEDQAAPHSLASLPKMVPSTSKKTIPL